MSGNVSDCHLYCVPNYNSEYLALLGCWKSPPGDPIVLLGDTHMSNELDLNPRDVL